MMQQGLIGKIKKKIGKLENNHSIIEEKSGKIVENWGKLGKIGKNREKSGKIGENRKKIGKNVINQRKSERTC